ncbi:MAG: COX15/CtaA family protein [Moraxellaceae bacterium]|nr:COX15/CtaA family protein [Pseudobdellovibrionaceae bacterium]
MINNINSKKISRGLYLFWIYTLVVIAWGAWVRISHSGNGCGEHWPLCNGDVIPNFSDQKTLVEFSHRIMSGLYGLLVLGIFVASRKKTVLTQQKKIGAYLLVFMIIEALLGALLVKQSLVTVNDSVFRLVVMSLHQLNSFLLTGVTYLLFLSTQQVLNIRITKLNVGFLILAVSGAVASLAATLFPSTSIWEGILKDFSSDSHLFVRLRVIHPLLAVSLISGVIYWLQTRAKNSVETSRLAMSLFVAMLVGIITLMTLSPLWLKITHLMLAHFVWAAILKYQLFGQHKPM